MPIRDCAPYMSSSPSRRARGTGAAETMGTKCFFQGYCAALVWIGLGLNFLSFALIASFIGGDALGAKWRDGRHFVSYKGHLTEVSSAVFAYSYFHGGRQLLTFPIDDARRILLAAERPAQGGRLSVAPGPTASSPPPWTWILSVPKTLEV